MNKVDWSKAPEWANWAWVGSIGVWFWGYEKPKWSWFIGTYLIATDSKVEAARIPGPLKWKRASRKASLEHRP